MITSTKNRQVVQTARLKKRALRDRERRFLVESARVAEEALEAGVVEALFHVPDPGSASGVVERARAGGVTVQAVSDTVMAHLTSTVTPQGILAVARYLDVGLEELPKETSLVPILCAVRDPGNAGTVLRSADAAGADAVVVTATSVDLYNPKTVRASAGSLFHLPIVRGVTAEEAVAAMRDRGLQILAAAADGELPLAEADLGRPTALLFGNEAWGLESEHRSLADRSIRIPIHGRAESLNLAAAAALVLFEAVRARDEGGAGPVAGLVKAAEHDIRSPLAALTGFVATLRANWDRVPEEERRAAVAGLAMEGHRVDAQARLLVDAVRLETDASPLPAAKPTSVGEAAHWVADLFRDGETAEVVTRGTAEVAMDPERLRAVLLALVEEAAWWGSRGPVQVQVRRAQNLVEIEVSRRGDGPDAGELETILAGPHAGGKVGLYAARLIAERRGGSLAALGGDGIRLLLRLPA